MAVEAITADLELSGLSPADFKVRQLTNAERAATRLDHDVQGYVIPYTSLDGGPLPFYRVRTFNHLPKYKQIKNTNNHLYFPAGVKRLIEQKRFCIITEGEKKAAKATKEGFPCVALGGIDSWRNRTLVLPEGTKFRAVPGKENQVSIKLEDVGIDIEEGELSAGLSNLIDYSLDKEVTLFICFDTDGPDPTFEVQRAAASLGFELRFRGVPTHRIRQLHLPSKGLNGHQDPIKVALDDFLVEKGREGLEALLAENRGAKRTFPQHPNIMEYVAKKLQLRLNRKGNQQLSLSILADLDNRGQRMRNKSTNALYLFVYDTKELLDVSLEQRFQDLMQSTEFSRYLFRTYGIANSDQKVLGWLATYFNTEHPMHYVIPQRVTTSHGDHIYHQLNDGQMAIISSEGLRVVDNGTDTVLFGAGIVEGIDPKQLKEEFDRQVKNYTLKPLWPEVCSELRLRDKEATPKFLSLLCYMSPWLQRWRGSQLPVEMCIGEAGSGKSSLYELRLSIQTGNPTLRNAPQTLRDWWASLANSGGLFVTDNMHAVDKSLKAQLSDEICRLVTEPSPHIEQRKLYTTNDVASVPICPTFAITAVQQPFRNADLMQRSVIFDFDKGEEAINFVSRWADQKIQQHGGRTAWLAHQFVILHRFLKLVKKEWSNDFRSSHRLINFEQSLRLMHKLVYPGEDSAWLSGFLTENIQENIQVADWAFEGLVAFADWQFKEHRNEPFTSQEIAEWAASEEDFKSNMQLTSSRSLGRYIQTHKQALAQTAGIKEMGKYGNKQRYYVDRGLPKPGTKRK